MLTLKPEQSYTRLSLYRVLKVKFLRWIDRTSGENLVRKIGHFSCALALFIAATAPSYLLGVLTHIARSKSLLGACLVVLYLYHRTLLRHLRRVLSRRPNGNCFHGVPIPELCDYLLERGAFPVEDASSALRLSQPQHGRIARELEKHGVLCRGESNARVLRPIARSQLAQQVSENFPLEWSEHEGIWVKRRDAFATYVLDREKSQKAEEDHVAKRERKLGRIEHRIGQLSTTPYTLPELA